eukprot:scaffold66727_cov105-Phaeocystis_antarctica.AAC.1
MYSSSTAVAHRDGRLHQQSGGMTRALSPNPFVLGIAATLWQHAAHWRQGANFASGWRPTHVMRTPSEQQRLAVHHGDEG